jgi:hypothetical protein
MKRNILLVAFLSAVMSVAFITEAWAAASAITSKTEKQLGANTRYIYIIPTVAASTTTVFKIPTLKEAGKIDEWHCETTSTDLDFWVSGLDAQAATAAPVLYVTGIDLSASLEIKNRDYVNMDTVQVKFLYLTYKNDDAVNATGASTFILDFVRN